MTIKEGEGKGKNRSGFDNPATFPWKKEKKEKETYRSLE